MMTKASTDSRLPQSNLRIGFLSAQNYFDWYAFSGILLCMYQALQRRGLIIVHLGQPTVPSLWQKVVSYRRKLQAVLGLSPLDDTAALSRLHGIMQKQLDQMECDVIFAPVAGTEVLQLKFQAPIVFLSDATTALLHEYYPWFNDEAELAEAHREEGMVIAKADQLVYSSEWAANSAINYYGADPNKISIIPFGANLVDVPSKQVVLQSRQQFDANAPCKLLFVGRDWHRKGGDTAYNTLLALCERNINAELWVVGCTPPDHRQHDRLRVIPHLNKNKPEQRHQLNKLLLESNFFIFPTRGDCSPIVLSEASAFGLPIITTAVGGIPTIVKHGKNGYTLPPFASGHDFAELIITLIGDRAQYQQLVATTRQEYEQRLNWDQWAERIHTVFIHAAQTCNQPTLR